MIAMKEGPCISRRLARATLAFLFAWGSGVVSAEPAVTVKARYYDVHGATAQELRQQLNRLGPPDRNGRRNDAYTKWDVTWRYTFRDTGAQCRIARVTTSAEIVVTLPRWKPPRHAVRDLREKWESYVAALQEHENGHRNIGVRAAHEVEHEIEALAPRGTCREMSEHANATGYRVIDKYRALEIRYDRDTLHGATQGAVFP